MKNCLTTVNCLVKGLVQGVGYRPFIYKTATDLDLTGTVGNRKDGVNIVIQGESKNIEKFISIIKKRHPPAAEIDSIEHRIIENSKLFKNFRIIKSEEKIGSITEVSPDIGVCRECLSDMKIQVHRLNYPLTNCINCGPRFSIIKSLPYDRLRTTMGEFNMCSICRNEYINPKDRRFHAQPVSCLYCGPVYTLHKNGNVLTEIEDILKTASVLIDDGNVIALKSLGGFLLLCNAFNKKAISNLRKIKNRKCKPFAVMVSNEKTAGKYAVMDNIDYTALSSWRKPIVLCKDKGILPSEINSNLSKTGIMLPYMPFHHMLFNYLETDCIVATSANLSDEPVITDNIEALEKFLPLTGCVITYNREIHNRCDDSLLFISEKKIHLVRRSRGWTPGSISLDYDCNGILAAGGELKNTFCIGRENKAILSQHIGNLKSINNEIFYKESIEKFSNLFDFKIRKIVHDLHPDYITTRYAQESGIKEMGVQHHWAHIASTLAEHRINRKVAGFAFDGSGYGHDKAVWGGEILLCDLKKFERYSHLDYVLLPGGDTAVKQPWRMGLSYLLKTYGKNFFNYDLPLFRKIENRSISAISEIITKGINSPMTSSMGRLFDAVSAITDLCLYSDFEAEAAMRLESEADKLSGISNLSEYYPFYLNIDNTINISPMIKAITEDTLNVKSKAEISLKFHNTIAELILFMAEKIRSEKGIKSVSLSGGVFYNKILLSLSEKKLKNAGFEIFTNQNIPAGDGGLSLGQLAIAAASEY